jgi:cystathionine beta-lyase family protein involved in aluminum resistance
MLNNFLKENFFICDKILNIAEQAENNIKDKFILCDKICEFNQAKVLYAMQKYKLSSSHFNFSSGYGYDDIGRDILEKIYACVFGAEDALVRTQIVSGTHAIYIALASNLNYGDELISISGTPYETIKNIINSSLISRGIIYKEINLKNKSDFDYENIKLNITNKTKIIMIQRSRGYSLRESLCVNKIKEAIKFIKNISNKIICFVDNCYGEFVEVTEPSESADLIAGSLIKNPGGGLANAGGYLVGKKKIIDNAAYFLTGVGKEIGASFGETFNILHGLFLAPQTVCCAIKTSIFAAKIFEILGFETYPKAIEKNRTDIIQAINLKSKDMLKIFCESIQKAGPVESFVKPIESCMPGYDNKIIMAAGTFIQGASIEFSCDAPIREPYTVFLQGAQTWSHGKIGVIIAANNLLKNFEV